MNNRGSWPNAVAWKGIHPVELVAHRRGGQQIYEISGMVVTLNKGLEFVFPKTFTTESAGIWY